MAESMSALTIPAGFALPGVNTSLSPNDTMFDGRELRYLEVGASALNVIEAAFWGAPEPHRILDLPCGFGRVTRMLRARYPTAKLTVCDLERAAVEFTAATFNARGIYSADDFRNLTIDDRFDLIWVGSLLTHLPEHQTRKFLDFAARHMGPESRLIVTSHGDYVATRLRSTTYGLTEAAACGLLTQYMREGYGYRGYDGDPSYGVSLAARAWYEALLAGSPLRLQSYYERGWDRHQDVLVLRRVPNRSVWNAFGSAPPRFEKPDLPLPLPLAEQERQDTESVPDFDENWYLETYADVAAAVRDGTWPSGMAHYLAFGWKEDRHPFAQSRHYAKRSKNRPDAWLGGVAGENKRVSEAWAVSPEQQAEEVGWYWLAHPAVRARSNIMASGSRTLDAYERLASLLRARGWTLPIAKSVSIGCGFGALERDLSQRGLIGEMDAYDIAEGAIAVAERTARQQGLQRIRYHVADLEKIDLPEASVDAVFAHSSVHHVERLEALYQVVQRTLRPGGIFHLHEYVGPTRFQWTDTQLQLANDFLESLPPRLRQMPDGTMKTVRRPTIEEMMAADPSESVRSAELVQTLEPFFDIIEYRALGGALAHIALGGIAQNFDPESAEDNAILDRLFAMEDAAMADKIIGSDFATITATPKPFASDKHASRRRKQADMRLSFSARAASLLPPARRLYEAVNALNATVRTLQSDQQRMANDIAALRSDLAAAPTPVAAPAAADAEAALDRSTRRELGEAALRNLPFRPNTFTIKGDHLEVTGYCGAPEGITQQMAFFINGQKIEDVEYPIEGPELKAQFPDVPGMGFLFRARIPLGILAQDTSRFWRFDASPNGHYNPAAWRQAMHYMNPAHERFAFPPVPNIKRVIGDTSAERFGLGGAIIFNNTAHYLSEIGKSWNDFPRILDWGCGAGRLTRYLIGETGSDVTGVDIDPDNIAWCQTAYAGGTFHVVPLRPPTDLPSGSFDLVFGVSVLTHLQERDQFLWLQELQRVTRPGALLFLSVQGPTQFSYNTFPPHLFRKLQQDGYMDLCRDGALDEVVSDTEYYRAAMHSRNYIVQRWGEYFDVLGIADAIAALQDFVVLRRR
jgi:SAM-dependent methyltransferase